MHQLYLEAFLASIEKRKSGDGRTSYRVKVRLKGSPTQSATFNRLTDAKKWVQQTETAIREGRHFRGIEAKKHTFAEAIERYEKSVLPRKPKSMSIQAGQLKWWKKQLGQFVLADITPSKINEAKDLLLSTTTYTGRLRSPATVNRYLAVVSHLFTTAINEWEWTETNPIRKISKPREPRGRVRFLSDKERKTLLDECKKSPSTFLYPIVVLALSTGMRKGEILNLKWVDIDFKRNLITLHDTKNGERRGVPLAGHALKTLRHLKKTSEYELVFPGQKLQKPIDIRTPWRTVVRKTKITNFKFHDLRHCAASYLAMNGASPAEIAEVLGHKTLQMVKRYAHLSDGHKISVVKSMNERIFK